MRSGLMSSTQESTVLARSEFTSPRRWTSILRNIGIRSPVYPPVVEALEDRLLLSRGPDHSGVLASVAAVDSTHGPDSHESTHGSGGPQQGLTESLASTGGRSGSNSGGPAVDSELV